MAMVHRRAIFTFVANNVQANILAARNENNIAGRIINIACDLSFSLFDLLRAINQRLCPPQAEVAQSAGGRTPIF
jgi:hypothetical protein